MKKFKAPSINHYLGYYLVFLVILACFAFQLFPSSDDYCHFTMAKSNGAFNLAQKAYREWTGRAIIYFFIGYFFNIFDAAQIEWIILINSFFYFGVTLIISRILTKSQGISLNSFTGFSIWVIVTSMFSIGMYEALAQIVFWATGGMAYIFPFFIFFLTLYVMASNEKLSAPELLLISVTSILSETLNPALFICIFFKYFLNFSDKKLIKQGILVLSIFAIGSGLFYFAPGNFARVKLRKTTIDYGITQLVMNYFYLCYKTLRYLWPAVVIGGLGGLCLPRNSFKIFNKRRLDILFFTCALASLAPLALVPVFYNVRASSFTVVLLSLSSFVFVATRFKYRLKFPVLFVNGAFAVVCLYYVANSFYASEIQNALDERHDVLSAKTQKGYEFYSLKEPKSLHLDDVGTQPKHWINQCVSNYYSVGSVKGINSK